MRIADKIMRELERLPEPLAQEVLDFIGYIELKYGLNDRLSEQFKAAQQPAMEHIWSNPEDEIWNDL